MSQGEYPSWTPPLSVSDPVSDRISANLAILRETVPASLSADQWKVILSALCDLLCMSPTTGTEHILDAYLSLQSALPQSLILDLASEL